MSSTPVSFIVGDVAYEFRPEVWVRVTAGQEDAPMPVMRNLVAEMRVIIDELRARVRELDTDLVKAQDEVLALRLKRGKGRVAP